MLNNKKNFDVVTPLNDFHRMSKRIAKDGEYMDVSTYPGMWVKLTNEGVMGTRAGTGAGYSALCISGWKANEGVGKYESHDTRSGSITVIVQPGVVARAGEAYFPKGDFGSISTGDQLSVISAGGIPDSEVGMLSKSVPGDLANAVVIGKTNDYVEYMLITPQTV